MRVLHCPNTKPFEEAFKVSEASLPSQHLIRIMHLLRRWRGQDKIVSQMIYQAFNHFMVVRQFMNDVPDRRGQSRLTQAHAMV